MLLLTTLLIFCVVNNALAKKTTDKALIGKLVKIPAGNFQMGSNDGRKNERPIRTVTVQPFYMQQHEVTWDQYQRCIDDEECFNTMKASDRKFGIKPDYGWGKGSRPVINVSWYDAQRYITWLNAQTGRQFRLPTEAEWEYAARAGTTTKYSWGDAEDCAKAHFGTHGVSDYVCGNKVFGTMPVKSYKPNAFGLYDMHGNVWEWVHDCWSSSYEGHRNDGSALSFEGCEANVLRGGSWVRKASAARSSNRSWGVTGAFDFGFRLVESIKPKK